MLELDALVECPTDRVGNNEDTPMEVAGLCLLLFVLVLVLLFGGGRRPSLLIFSFSKQRERL